MPVVLKRWSVPTGEPDNTERVPSGSVGGWGKRSVSYLARSLPNLVPRIVEAILPQVHEKTPGYCWSSPKVPKIVPRIVRC